MTEQFDKDEFLDVANVSRETLKDLEHFEALLRKWNTAINVVSKRTLDKFWQRHIFDSAQLLGICTKNSGLWADFGSGGGLPGLVVAIIAREQRSDIRFNLVESDNRKATFLRTVVRELGLNAAVISERIEQIDSLGADVISARALAPLSLLLKYSAIHLLADGQALFLKGKTFRTEITEAVEKWSFTSKEYVSKTDPSAVVLSIGAINRV